MPAPDLLARIDRAIAELQAIRAAVAGEREREFTNTELVDPSGADDLADEHLIDTHSAAARFNYPTNTLAKWCRTEGLGVKRGGRWLISIPRMQRRLNGS